MAYILIVDDDNDYAEAISTLLTNKGYDVAIENDIQSGLSSIREQIPDLLLLDVMFPEDSSAGFSMARRIREEPGRIKELPILMLTAVNTMFPLGFATDDIDEDWLPVQAFVEKSIDLDVLCQKVQDCLLGANE